MDLYLPQEVIDQIIGCIEDKETLPLLRLVSRPWQIQASRFYFKHIFVMLSSKSAANIEHLSKSPYSSYIEELHWADKELQYQLSVDLEAFQDTFKERLAGLPSEAVQEWHEKYRALYIDQESLYYPGTGKQRFDVESFVNLKRVSVINACKAGAEQYPTALEAPEILHHPARWSTTRQFRSQRGNVYARIIQSLAALNRLTHLCVKIQGPKWERLFASAHPLQSGSGPVSLLENIKHLDVDVCLPEGRPNGDSSTPRCHISGLEDATNLESLTWKSHIHIIDEIRNFYVTNHHLIQCLATLQPSFQSIIFMRCLFESSLTEIFMDLRRKKLVPPVAIFERCREFVDLSDRLKLPILSELDVTEYLVKLGIKETLCLHSWDEQIEAYWNSTTREEQALRE